MVEFFRGKPDDLEIQAMMIAVTDHALFAFYFRGGVIAFVCSNSALKFSVAVEALLVRNLFSENVAFRAVRQSFQVCMDL